MNMELVKVVAKTGVKIGKKIVIEGTKATVIGAFAVGVSTLVSSGMTGIKALTFDELIGIETEVKVEVVEVVKEA